MRPRYDSGMTQPSPDRNPQTRTLLILGAVIAVLLIALVAVLAFALGRDSGDSVTTQSGSGATQVDSPNEQHGSPANHGQPADNSELWRARRTVDERSFAESLASVESLKECEVYSARGDVMARVGCDIQGNGSWHFTISQLDGPSKMAKQHLKNGHCVFTDRHYLWGTPTGGPSVERLHSTEENMQPTVDAFHSIGWTDIYVECD